MPCVNASSTVFTRLNNTSQGGVTWDVQVWTTDPSTCISQLKPVLLAMHVLLAPQNTVAAPPLPPPVPQANVTPVPNSSNNNNLPLGMVIGISVGGVIVVLIVVLVQWVSVWASLNVFNAQQPRSQSSASSLSSSSLILWLLRQSSVIDPRLAFCDDHFFVCSDWKHLGVRQLELIVSNEAEVLDALRHVSEQRLNVTASDFNLLPFDEQLQQVVAADILAGPHGAGLTHLLFMRDNTCVFELFVAGSDNSLHYTNMASWRGLRYGSLSADPPEQERVAEELVASYFVPTLSFEA